MVAASYCETLRILLNITFNVLSTILYSENYWRDTSIVFHFGINTTLSRKLLKKTTNLCGTQNLAKNHESLWNRVVQGKHITWCLSSRAFLITSKIEGMYLVSSLGGYVDNTYCIVCTYTLK